MPSTLMVWSVTDRIIEDSDLLQAQFDDLHRSGFGGVAAFVRCSRYSWHDKPAQLALKEIGRLCRDHQMDCWLGPDPRFVSRQLIPPGGGLQLLLFGDRPRADVFPHCTPIVDQRFNVRCELTPRHVHMLNEVAIEYAPQGVERLYAVRAGKAPLERGDVIDLTSSARMFYNARDRYVEAFGTWEPPDEGVWNAVAFFRVLASHVDYSDPDHIRRYVGMLGDLRRHGVTMDSLMWDEPGFTCTYGTLPFSPTIIRSMSHGRGKNLKNDLWKLAFDSSDGSHIPLRVEYYRLVQRMVNRAHLQTNRASRRLWGPRTQASIHDTWHFESADMCDMNHGSLDLWEGVKATTGGFVDLGDVHKLRDSESPWNAHLAAMSVICSSLGKISKGKFAFNNLWTVGDDNNEGWQVSAMDHCVNVMAAFGTRWLAHAYGPVGTIGQERSFLGSPPLPGYPDHSTWSHFPGWNQRLAEHFGIIGNSLPWSNVLVVFPVESLYALADLRADAAATAVFQLLLALLDAHYHVDVLSPSQLLSGRWRGNILEVQQQHYSAIIYPSATVMDPRVERLLAKRPARTLYAFRRPERSTANRPIRVTDVPHAEDAAGILQWLEEHKVARPVKVPRGTWVTLTHAREATVVCVVPSRHGITFQGTISYLDQASAGISNSGLTRIVYKNHSTPLASTNKRIVAKNRGK